MGTSITLLKKEFLELSLEIDRELSLEISTGFCNHQQKCHVSTLMEDVSLKEIDEILSTLTKTRNELETSWVCVCGNINHSDWEECNTCDIKPKQKIPLKDYLVLS